MRRITGSESAQVFELERRLGSRTFRQVMTPAGKRLLRPERLENLLLQRGRISQEESERLQLVQSNARAIENLERKNADKPRWKVRRAIRDWLENGKAPGIDYKNQDQETKQNQQRAIRALRYLGVDPSEGTYYVRRRKAA